MGKQKTSQEKPPMGKTEIFQNGREQKLGICRRLQESRQKGKDKAGTISRHPYFKVQESQGGNESVRPRMAGIHDVETPC